ncbi:MAG: serine/threonine-protein kinase [Pseudomonadota bacterium]
MDEDPAAVADDIYNFDTALDQLLDAADHERESLLQTIGQHHAEDAARLRRLLAYAEDSTVLPTSIDEAAPALFASLAESQDRDRIGTQLGPYLITALINRGGMGVVFRAKRNDGAFEQSVAVKFLPRLAQTSDRRQLFMRERANLARLEHPNIARIIDAGVTADDTPYFVMEYVEGPSLFESIPSATEAVRLQLFEDLCSAVAYCHQSLIVHGDLKPSNILVANNRLRLLDFGIARLLGDKDTDVATGFTPGYAAPELIEGQPPSVLTDIFALGALLNEMFKDRNEELRQIAEKCTQPEPAARYSSVDALISDLRAYRRREPISLRASDRSYIFRKYLQRNKAIVVGITATVAALTTGLVIALWQYNLAAIEAQRAKETATFVRSLFDRASPELAGAEDVTLRQLMDEAAARLEQELNTAPDVRYDLMGLIGSGYYGIGEYAQARKLQRRALDYFSSTKKYPSREIAIAQRAVAIDLYQAGEFDAARSMIKKAADQFEDLNMPLLQADALGRFGQWTTTTDPSAALAAVERERELLLKLAPENTLQIAINLARKGGAVDALGDYRTGLQHKLRALELAASIDASTHTYFITTLCNAAVSYHGLLEWQRALEVGQQCIDATIERYGDAHPDLVPRFATLAAAWLRLNQPERARPYAESAVNLAKATLPERAYSRMAAEANLARIQLQTGETATAVNTFESLYQRMMLTAGVESHPTARMLSLLGRAQFLNGNVQAARESLTRAATLFQRGEHAPAQSWADDLQTWLQALP